MSTNGSMHLATNGGSMVTNVHNGEKYRLMRRRSPTSSVMPRWQIGTGLPMTLRKYIVHLPDKTVRFEKIGMNVYVFKPPTIQAEKSENALMLNTVEENKKFYTECQFEIAK